MICAQHAALLIVISLYTGRIVTGISTVFPGPDHAGSIYFHWFHDWAVIRSPGLFSGGSPLYGLYRYVPPYRVGFPAVLGINRLSILVILVLNRVCLCAQSCSGHHRFLIRSCFSLMFDKSHALYFISLESLNVLKLVYSNMAKC